MSELAFDLECPTIGVVGLGNRFPVRRVWCVGSNYRKPDRDYTVREAPYFFSKQPDMVLGADGCIPHPGSGELRFEVELVVAIGSSGAHIPEREAESLIYGYATGMDMTRRDLLVAAEKAGKPWEIGKSFDGSAPVGEITPLMKLAPKAAIQLWQNGTLRQNSTIDRLIWTVPEIICRLSALVALAPGDLIFTGTPSGHGPCQTGDRLEARVDGLAAVRLTIG